MSISVKGSSQVKLLVCVLGLDRLPSLADHKTDIQHFQMFVICYFSVADIISLVKKCAPLSLTLHPLKQCPIHNINQLIASKH